MEKETQDPIVISRGATDLIENASSTNSSLVDPILQSDLSQHFYFVILKGNCNLQDFDLHHMI